MFHEKLIFRCQISETFQTWLVGREINQIQVDKGRYLEQQAIVLIHILSKYPHHEPFAFTLSHTHTFSLTHFHLKII